MNKGDKPESGLSPFKMSSKDDCYEVPNLNMDAWGRKIPITTCFASCRDGTKNHFMAESFKCNPLDLSSMLGASSWQGYWVKVGSNSDVSLSPAAILAVVFPSCVTSSTTPVVINPFSIIYKGGTYYILGSSSTSYSIKLTSDGSTITTGSDVICSAFIVTSLT